MKSDSHHGNSQDRPPQLKLQQRWWSTIWAYHRTTPSLQIQSGEADPGNRVHGELSLESFVPCLCQPRYDAI